MRFGKRVLSMIFVLVIAATLAPCALAATREELDQPGVFLDQQRGGACVITSTAMMLRRAELLRGNEDWASVTTADVPSWMPYRFTVNGLDVVHERLPGGEANRQYLIDLLAEHPEGVVLYARCVPHAVLLTDYTDGQFYCSDPAVCCPRDRITIDGAWGTRVENSVSIWYITTELPALEEPKSDEEIHRENIEVGITQDLPHNSVAALMGLTEWVEGEIA